MSYERQKNLIVLFTTLMLIAAMFITSHAFGMTQDMAKSVMDLAKSQLYVRELHPPNGNRSPEIDGYLKYLGLPPGLSYCISFDIWAIGKAYEAKGKRCPVPKYGKCSTFLKQVKKDKYAYTVIPAKQVEYGAAKLKPAMIAIWSHGNPYHRDGGYGSDKYEWSGHAELIDLQNTVIKFDTVGANTTGVDDAALQREQKVGSYKPGTPLGGVWKKKRSVSKMDSFYCEAFVEVN